MKKLVAVMLVVLVGGIAVIAGFVWYRMDKVNYRSDIIKYAGEAQPDGMILATYKGRTTRILGSNVERLIWALTIGEGQRYLQLTDRNCPGDNVALAFGEKLKIAVCPLEDGTDAVFIRFKGPGKVRYYTLQGYKTMEWLEKIISPEGYWEPNEEVETKV